MNKETVSGLPGMHVGKKPGDVYYRPDLNHGESFFTAKRAAIAFVAASLGGTFVYFLYNLAIR